MLNQIQNILWKDLKKIYVQIKIYNKTKGLIIKINHNNKLN